MNKTPCLRKGQNLSIIAAATANVISENLTANEIAVLAGFFTVLGDALALNLSAAAICDSDEPTASDSAV